METSSCSGGTAAQQVRLAAQTFEEELDTASRLLQDLMPQHPPQLSGFDVAGRCVAANHVGGDFYQYYSRSDGRLTISVADVTGHAMEAAIPGVMFSGILESQMESGAPLEELFGRLNRTLHKTLDKRTFVCLLMGELDPETGEFRFANCGCPYPFYRSSTNETIELVQDNYPLSIRPRTIYEAVQTTLESGDRIVFCSDGIPEAMNSAEEMFGFERTSRAIRDGCADGLSASQVIDRLMGRVHEFIGSVPRADDMTCVVLGAE